MTVKDIVCITENISYQYKNIVDNKLLVDKEEILKNLKEVFYDNDNKFNLVYSNPLYDNKKAYEFICRIKEEKSFHEKLNRKNIIFDLIKKLDLNKQNYKSKEKLESINEYILEKLDDNIGIMILCDLQSDCKEALNLIINHVKEFKNITFHNLADQPKTMKNGLQIYKIECTYKEINFELQIKSKIFSAWSDIEHNLYYKDHKIDIIKEINKLSMSHVGVLLKQLDDYLSDLRGMNNGAYVNVEDIEFLTKIEDRYLFPIKNTISENFIFDFSSISKQLIHMIDKKEVPSDRSTNFKFHLENILNHKLLRHDSWQMIILESIYKELCGDDFNEDIYLEKYFQYITTSINCREELKDNLKMIFDIVINRLNGSEHLIDLKYYKDVHELFKRLSDPLFELMEYENFKKDEEKNILKYFGLKVFGINDSVDIKDYKEHIIHILIQLNKDYPNELYENEIMFLKNNVGDSE
ncbi:hypothetical protein [Aliarcobacter cryaerophilus]|uniref:hypothetical protein n=1 Tax=Aliarcobacter cryaerophilus TaxID=28198 RepID=UPI000824ECF6|nr:hypothetical protein [Aliarcobacter cryaerophilus]